MIDILGSIDAKIENNQKIKTELCDYRYSIFQKKFIISAETDTINFRKISLSELIDYAGGSQPPASEFINEYKIKLEKNTADDTDYQNYLNLKAERDMLIQENNKN